MLELDELTMVFTSKPMIVGVVPQSNSGAVVGEEGWVNRGLVVGFMWWMRVVVGELVKELKIGAA